MNFLGHKQQAVFYFPSNYRLLSVTISSNNFMTYSRSAELTCSLFLKWEVEALFRSAWLEEKVQGPGSKMKRDASLLFPDWYIWTFITFQLLCYKVIESWIYEACSELPGHHIHCSESCYDAINFSKYSRESPQITECFTSTVMWQKGQAWYPPPHTNPVNFTATPRTVATKRKKCNLSFEVTYFESSFIYNLVLLQWCGSLNTNTIWLSLNAFYINVA